jgi:hypothetical protein
MTLVIAAEHISESRYSNDVINRRRQRRQLHNALSTTGAANTPDSDGVTQGVADDGSGSGQEIDGNGGARTLQRRRRDKTCHLKKLAS